MKARVCRFYGWSPSTVDNMPVREFYNYSKAVDVLTSEEQLRAFEVEFSTHVKKEKRKDIVEKYRRRIRQGIDRSGGKLASIQDVAKAFAGMITNGGRKS